MPTILQKLRSGLAKVDEYIHEHDLADKLESVPTVGGFLIVLCLVVIGIYVVTVVPHVFIQHSLDAALRADRVKQLELEDTYRKTITQIVLGVFGLFLLYFTWRRSVAGDKTVRIAEQGHITDRFTKAIEQLGKTDGDKPNIEVRLGAIYALERIAIDSPRDHWTIMEVLTAYVRQNAPLDPDRPYAEGEKPRTDIQGILTVLGRRKTSLKRERLGQVLDLSKSRLCGANLVKVNLQQANLMGANLQRSSLCQANLQQASLGGGNLQQAFLEGSNLQRAFLSGGNLQQARLVEANLQQADLANANLRIATLWNANLENASLVLADMQMADFENANMQRAAIGHAKMQQASSLTVDQVKSAEGWQSAHYSPAFRAELGLPPERAEDAPQPDPS